ncbi:MAG TPA: bifunctional molybdenum cofactor biosynthesis protein MoaC/MoaB [Bacteroidia bacterium]|jgi:molybdenum cofactor biosynthesis protein MoaC|nr:bifunctional molybdenum cofactor biosynthesis protein MoaC/MoaB [Bacteroidia bacterium]
MVDITSKSNTLRSAIAQAVVKLSNAGAMEALRNKTVPKGDVFEMAKAAGLLAVKRTSDLIPDCHPLPIEFASVKYEIQEMEIRILMEVKTVYKTGVEVEAMHGASVVALTVYDMLKPLDKGIEIGSIRLLEKKGGKSDRSKKEKLALKAAVLIISDSVVAGIREDKSGKAIAAKLKTWSVNEANCYEVSDSLSDIQSKIRQLINEGNNLIVTTGGTGLSPRDVTPEAIRPLLDREIPGLMETARAYGQARTPFAMLSRSLAGFSGDTLILALPGSPAGAVESMDALFPQILHVFDVKKGAGHDEV